MAIELNKQALDIGIVVSNQDEALRFYRDTLGFPEIEIRPLGGGGTLCRLQCGSSHIKLWCNTGAAAKPAPGGPGGGAMGYRYCTVHVRGLDQLVEKIKAAGYEVPTPPREIRPGARIAMVADPDGNWVELLESTT